MDEKSLAKQLALMQYLDEVYFYKEIEGEDIFYKGEYDPTLDLNTFELVEEYDLSNYDNDYLVLTDAEADDLWDEELDNYIEECILPDLPEYLKKYFNEEAWKSDAKYDGRGHGISHYDGKEYEEHVEYFDKIFYIYRQN